MAIPLIRTAARLGLCVVTAIFVCPLVPASAAADGSHDLVVPKDYPTIQAAVDAAHPGDRITVRPGVYREQVVIGKDVSITGSGDRKTTIQAPQTLTPGDDGGNSIVEIHNGASVSLSRLSVSGPGSGTCDDGALGSGIRVLGGARLDLRHAAVTHITDTPAAPCFHSATAVFIGDLPTGTGSATIRDTRITGYQGAGVVVLNEGSTATIQNSTVTGHPTVSTDGIEFVEGAVGRVTGNTISGNECREPDAGCGPDFFNEFQHAGVVGDAPGTVVQHNRIIGNQVGIYVAGKEIDIAHNDLQRNSYVGIALQDGSFTVRKDRIKGGVHGVVVIASAVHTNAVLEGVKITQTSDAPVQTFECCGFTATATVNP
ncbi:right-handed parallel beta-helix repeat-containing protein [Streptomyces sp. NBC_00555]|uniref:right-handed parallel beta-helix repeat-containing protein n=1 Tax=Streptomyces sp. NBC_00555 TaxID=2903662 RepID=UPI00225C3427|nr:right-handed parallel beta-helix repeat-containing protein [Streptomyces sp. NBC_00555]MCX5009467.1 right-handed parallel beta-helix repeat-containing protein [Streptomyces sp. NBC_00555]